MITQMLGVVALGRKQNVFSEGHLGNFSGVSSSSLTLVLAGWVLALKLFFKLYICIMHSSVHLIQHVI